MNKIMTFIFSISFLLMIIGGRNIDDKNVDLQYHHKLRGTLSALDVYDEREHHTQQQPTIGYNPNTQILPENDNIPKYKNPNDLTQYETYQRQQHYFQNHIQPQNMLHNPNGHFGGGRE